MQGTKNQYSLTYFQYVTSKEEYMSNLLSTLGIQLSWIDGLVILAIYVIVEKIIKHLICKDSTSVACRIIYVTSPVVLGILVYVVAAIALKHDVPSALKLGAAVGASTAWFYDAIKNYFNTTGKDKGTGAAKEIGQDVADIVAGK